MPSVEVIVPSDEPGPLALCYHCYRSPDLAASLTVMKQPGPSCHPGRRTSACDPIRQEALEFPMVSGFGLIEIIED
jgi:hypothetical protein